MVRLPHAQWLGVAVSAGAVVAITVVLAMVPSDPGTAIPALLLVVPVVVAAVQSGVWASLCVAAMAGVAQAYMFLPPIKSVRVHIAEDLLTLAAFLAVATAVSFVAGPRRRAPEHLFDEGHSRLLRSVSHDLRNPLGTIRAVSTDLRSGMEYDASTRGRLLDVVIEESERLDRIVGNLLSVSRVDAGALLPDRRVVAIDAVVRASVARVHRLTEDPITIDVPCDLQACADPVQVDQVLTNILDNAVRHTPPGTRVRVTARREGDRVRIVVADDGPGFDPALKASLFEPFRPGATGRSGLGLAVCRFIVEAHGGTIAAGDDPSGGARITFTIPIAD